MNRHVLMMVAMLALLLVGSTGCISNTFDYPSRQADGRMMEESRTFFIYGLVDGNDRPVVAHELCNGPVKSVETVHTFGNMCISCVTISIYTPNTVRVTCASGTAHNFYLDEDDAVVGHEVVDGDTGEVVQSEFKSDFI
ncbi:hypothetical protein DV096_11475 [Bradymonadaceae bacterium TMQ3]|uniref:Lipoprotein n=1 Tax=Lujinxingia sediminis TaxID=2480984 RepID=A0ABY0CSM3_9DELT|nr:hypothetical protein [Lujinxingia sediminis]RDV37733.1 hypothetical protein DV096_11475 [Bradymonadaceae bacterium TMQ3]RVU43137.1 hypothetical protein EA187_13060 [Lujinxingia sediminis]TXC75484.1 hypothetical protein FRC91_12280 [Bradymonadales bacterium TMQ1]